MVIGRRDGDCECTDDPLPRLFEKATDRSPAAGWRGPRRSRGVLRAPTLTAWMVLLTLDNPDATDAALSRSTRVVSLPGDDGVDWTVYAKGVREVDVKPSSDTCLRGAHGFQRGVEIVLGDTHCSAVVTCPTSGTTCPHFSFCSSFELSLLRHRNTPQRHAERESVTCATTAYATNATAR